MATPSLNRLLLDTCAIIWIGNKSPLAREALSELVAATLAGQVHVSPVSAWEIGLLAARGRFGSITTAAQVDHWFSSFLARNGVLLAPLTVAVALHSAHLPEFTYRDPADRFLVATARSLNVPIMTRDDRILDYARRGHVGAVPC